MALTKAQVREILSSAGVASENMQAAVDKIIDGHVASIEALREEITTYKVDAEKLPTVQKELDDLKSAKGDGWKEKYESEHTQFEEYKTQVETEKASNAKKDLYRAMLKSINVDDKRIDSILRVTDISKLTVKDGKLEDEENLKTTAKTEWADFISVQGAKGAQVDNPPKGGTNMTKEAFDKMSLSERMAYANAHPAEAAEYMK